MKFISKFLCSVAVLVLLAFMAATASAQQTALAPQVYPLTNSTTMTISGGYAMLTNVQTLTIASAPVPVFRGRGFNLNVSMVATNASTSNVTFAVEMATRHRNGGTFVTNWVTAPTAYAFPLSGTSTVYYTTNVANTVWQGDNVGMVRLKSIASGHNASIFIDPTNTFISVIP